MGSYIKRIISRIIRAYIKRIIAWLMGAYIIGIIMWIMRVNRIVMWIVGVYINEIIVWFMGVFIERRISMAATYSFLDHVSSFLRYHENRSLRTSWRNFGHHGSVADSQAIDIYYPANNLKKITYKLEINNNERVCVCARVYGCVAYRNIEETQSYKNSPYKISRIVRYVTESDFFNIQILFKLYLKISAIAHVSIFVAFF